MSQCVPSWDLKLANSTPIVDYAVAELTWENGQLAMHGLGPPRTAETLESIVNQATHHKPQLDVYGGDLVPWLDQPSPAIAAASGSASASVTMTMDALVPSTNRKAHARCSTRVGSCSGDQRVATAAHEWSSASGSATFGMDSSRQFTVETCERELGVKGFTSTSMGSPENTATKSTSPDELDSVGYSSRQKNSIEEKKRGKGKPSVSTKRSRAAAIHNQSERKRRDKINQKMKTLQKLVPNANKTDKASMLDEVIEYLKQLQAQIHMMSRMNMSSMMIPLAMHQQQLQMAMMNPMGMGMGIGMGMGLGMPGVMDLNAIGTNHSNIPGMSPVLHPSTFMQPTMATWDMHAATDRLPNPNNPMATFLGSQSQPMTMDAYSRMVALFHHMSGPKN